MYYRDPTSSSAIRSVDREWRKMAIKAFLYRTDPQYARRIRNPEHAFPGIYRRLLTDPLKELIHYLPVDLMESAALMGLWK